MWNNLKVEGPILRPLDAAKYLGISLSAFYAQIKSDNLPPLIKISARASGMPKPWLDLFLSRRFGKHILIETHTEK